MDSLGDNIRAIITGAGRPYYSIRQFANHEHEISLQIEAFVQCDMSWNVERKTYWDIRNYLKAKLQ